MGSAKKAEDGLNFVVEFCIFIRYYLRKEDFQWQFVQNAGEPIYNFRERQWEHPITALISKQA